MDSNRGPPDYKSGALPTELRRLISKVKTIIYQANCPRIEHLAFSRLRQHLDSAKPLFGIFLSSVPTQHLIAPIPQPCRDDRCVSSLRFDPIVDDPTDVGLVVEDVLDRHSGEGFPSTSQNLLTIQSIGHFSQRPMLGIQLEDLRHHHSL